MSFPRGFRINGPKFSTKSKINFSAKMDSIIIRFRLYWNQRFKYWELSSFTDAGDVIVEGKRVVADYDMWEPYSDVRLPPGSLVCKDTTELGQKPGRNDFRDRHFLMYVEVPEPEPLGVTIKPFVLIE